MNKKTIAIYICIIIVFGNLLFRPQVARGECADTIAQVYDALVAAAASMRNPADVGSFLSRMQDILFSRDVTPCDSNGNPIAVPTVDPNITDGPTPTIDPNAPTPPPGDGSLAFFCQADPVLQDSSVSPAIINEGCGPTSMAMINCTKNGYDNSSKMSCNPKAAPFAKDLKSRYCASDYGYVPCYGSSGTYFSNEQGKGTPAVLNILKDMGRQVEIIPADLAQWDKKIKAGALLLTYAPDTPCSLGCAAPRNRKLAHIFVVDSVDVTAGKAHLRDPIHCGSSTEYAEVDGGRWLNATDTVTTSMDSFQIRTAFSIR